MKAIAKKSITMMMAFVMTFGICAPLSLLKAPEVHAAKTYTFRTETHRGNGHRYAYAECNGMKGLCAEAGAYMTYSGKAKFGKEYSHSSDIAKVAYWYGYKNGGRVGNRIGKAVTLPSLYRKNPGSRVTLPPDFFRNVPLRSWPEP